jgi:hypothetical protein
MNRYCPGSAFLLSLRPSNLVNVMCRGREYREYQDAVDEVLASNRRAGGLPQKQKRRRQDAVGTTFRTIRLVYPEVDEDSTIRPLPFPCLRRSPLARGCTPEEPISPTYFTMTNPFSQRSPESSVFGNGLISQRSSSASTLRLCPLRSPSRSAS